MKRWWIIGGVGVAVSVASVGGWMLTEAKGDSAPVNSAGGSIALKSDAPSPAANKNASGLVVVTPVPGTNTIPVGGAQGMPTGSGTGGAAARSGNAAPTAAPQPPGPSEFHQYDQYLNSQDALFGDMVVGTGPEVKVGSQVTVHYRGWLTNGTEFDESYARGKPFTFQEGAHKVILGWEQGLLGMKGGGKRRLVVPPRVGYGDQAVGSIPAGSLLVFDVELLGVE